MRLVRSLTVWVAFGATLSGAPPADAQTSASCPASASAAAKERYEKLDLTGAADATLNVERCIDGTVAELAEALRWRAQAHATRGDPDAAIEAFVLMETIAPGYDLGSLVSPKLHDLQRAARAKARTERPFRGRLLLPVYSAPGVLQLTLEPFDPFDRVGKVTFLVDKDGVELPVAATRGASGRFQATVKGSGFGSYRARVEATDGASFDTLASALPAAPRDAPVAVVLEPAPKPAPVLPPQGAGSSKGAVVGIAVGAAVVVVAAVIVGGLVVSSAKPTGTLGRIEIP